MNQNTILCFFIVGLAAATANPIWGDDPSAIQLMDDNNILGLNQVDRTRRATNLEQISIPVTFPQVSIKKVRNGERLLEEGREVGRYEEGKGSDRYGGGRYEAKNAEEALESGLFEAGREVGRFEDYYGELNRGIYGHRNHHHSEHHYY